MMPCELLRVVYPATLAVMLVAFTIGALNMRRARRALVQLRAQLNLALEDSDQLRRLLRGERPS